MLAVSLTAGDGEGAMSGFYGRLVGATPEDGLIEKWRDKVPQTDSPVIAAAVVAA